MPSYLLLRDNKESGPFSLGELQHFGLKPYDLIWVEGKSAAWRYPSEIEELRPFAPVVEEQPFDRFFKKGSDSEKKPEAPSPIEEQYSRYIPSERNEEVPPPRRSVFVTLPGGRQETPKRTPPAQKPVTSPAPQTHRSYVPREAVSTHEDPVTAEIKYSQPLDEIKQMYVKTLQERKDKRAKKGNLVSNMKKAAVVVGLVAIGLFAGFLVRSKPSDPDLEKDVATGLSGFSASVGQAQPEQNGSEPLIDPAGREEPTGDPDRKYQTMQQYDAIPADDEPAPMKIRKETMIIVPKKKEDYNRRDTPGASVNPLTGERESNRRTFDNPPTLPRSATDNLKSLVSVSSNDYKRVAFGGIRNLHLTVDNRSPYTLDEVIVELQYLKPSEEPLRTENISFKSIGAKESATIRIPDTNRGIRVSYRIINIESRQNDLARGE